MVELKTLGNFGLIEEYTLLGKTIKTNQLFQKNTMEEDLNGINV